MILDGIALRPLTALALAVTRGRALDTRGTGIQCQIRLLICAPMTPNPTPDRRSRKGVGPRAVVSSGAGRVQSGGELIDRYARQNRTWADLPCSNSCDLRVLERRAAIFFGGQSPLDSAAGRGASIHRAPRPLSRTSPASPNASRLALTSLRP